MRGLFGRRRLTGVNKKRENAKRIRRLREKILQLNQGEFAAKIPVARSRVSEWEAAKRTPSAEHLYRLGSIAPASEDTLWFWNQAGLDEQKILTAARKLALNAEGERTIPIPRYRYTPQRIEETGPPVPLPTEFIPNPGSTICLVVDKPSTGALGEPRGTFIVDESVKGKASPQQMLHKVVVFSFTPSAEWDKTPPGIYIGRLTMAAGAWIQGETGRISHHWSLASLVGDVTTQWLDIDTMWETLPFNVPINVPMRHEGPAFMISELNDYIKDREEDREKVAEITERMLSEFRFPSGNQILGQVIGRLSGNVK